MPPTLSPATLGKSLIENWLATPSSQGVTITTEYILIEVIKMDTAQQTEFNQKAVGVILRRLGHSRKKTKVKGYNRWIYQLTCSP